MNKSFQAIGLLALIIGFFAFRAHPAQALTRHITFPVLGPVSYSNDYGAPRVGHTHIGNDILGQKMQPLLAAVTGTARQVAFPEPSYGWYLSIEDPEGYTYVYIHINNDTPGTDDNMGGGNYAYAPNVDRGYPVVAGQVVAYMGDSGNAEATHPHLHFEIHNPDGSPFNPYPSLQAATRLSRAVTTPTLSSELLPYGQFKWGANIASGDVAPGYLGNELVIGPGVGALPLVRMMTPDGILAGGFYLPQTTFRGGADVAVGDVNGDGTNEIITGLGPGGEPVVQIHNRKGLVLSHFLAYPATFRGGVHVSTADIDGDGVDEIITGAGRGGSPEVRIFKSDGTLIKSFLAYTARFHGGVDVAGISSTAGQAGEIVTTPGAGGGPDVRVYTPDGGLLSSFIAGDSTFHGGLRVTTAVNPNTGQLQIITVPMSLGRGVIRQFTLGGQDTNDQFVFERWWTGGYDVTVMDGTIYTSSLFSDRRGSIMKNDQSPSSFDFGFDGF